MTLRGYSKYRLKEWMQTQVREQEYTTWIDGSKINIKDILEYHVNDTILDFPLSLIWDKNYHEAPWENNDWTLERMLDFVQFSPRKYINPIETIILLRKLKYTPTKIDHLIRIKLFQHSIDLDLVIPPILVDENFIVVDGFHRLLAHKGMGLSRIRGYLCKINSSL